MFSTFNAINDICVFILDKIQTKIGKGHGTKADTARYAKPLDNLKTELKSVTEEIRVQKNIMANTETERITTKPKKTQTKAQKASVDKPKTEAPKKTEAKVEDKATSLEKSKESEYNDVGGKTDGEEKVQNGKPSERGTGDIQADAEGVRGRTNINESGQGNGGRTRRTSISGEGRNVVLSERTNAKLRRLGVKVNDYEISRDAETFVKNLKDNASTQKYGACVFTDYKVEDLKGAKLIQSKSGNVTIGVKADGDIFGLAKNANASRKEFDDAMYITIESGGKKMDAYGIFLTNTYSKFGFIPVARSPYNETFVKEAEKPIFEELATKNNHPVDVYAFVHNGDSVAVAKKANEEVESAEKELKKAQRKLDKLKKSENVDEAKLKEAERNVEKTQNALDNARNKSKEADSKVREHSIAYAKADQ